MLTTYRFTNFIYPLLFMMMLTTSSCHQPDFPDPGQIAVSWEVLSNTFSETPRVKAEFVLTNNGKTTLTDRNWELYWNQSPRNLIGTSSSKPVLVERINGDWYKLTPLENFSLLPGESVSIVYESEFWWIKESDSPMGLYWVFRNEHGVELLAEVADYKLLPFERPEQISRHKGDFLPMATADVLFEQNKKLSVLPQEQHLPIIPSPAKYIPGNGNIILGPEINIFFDAALIVEARHLADKLGELTGIRALLVQDVVNDQGISLKLNNSTCGSPEAYRLKIAENNTIEISGSGKQGVFYGIQSLLALIPVEKVLTKAESIELPVITVEDTPRFAYRGVHLDVARNFFPKEAILKMIDVLAFYKINQLHLHLTEDEGWRIEIPGLPELTEVGSRRAHTTKDAAALHPAYGSGPFAEAAGKTGSGYYTTSDFIEILEYAASHHIRVIPEINMPGHSRAAIKAMEARYNYFMERGDEAAANEFRLIDPDDKSVYLSAQLYNDNVVNVARESAYRFFEKVLDAIVDMYSQAGLELEIFHIGGDEVPHGAWTASPMIERLLPSIPHIDYAGNMHAWFHARVRDLLAERNIRMAGWEEMALIKDENGAHVPNQKLSGGEVIPYVWNNLWGAQDLAYRLANAGFPVVASHVSNFYFDLAYNNDPREPGLYWAGFVDVKNAWHYNPFDVFKTTLLDNMGRPVDIEKEYSHMERLNKSARENIMGLQAQLWSETILSTEMLEYYLLPKLIGFAESAWTAERRWEKTQDAALRHQQVEEDWNIFANTIAAQELPRLSVLAGGFNHRIPPPGAVIENGVLKVNTAFPGLTVRYTTDGSEPHENSPIISNEITINTYEAQLKAFDAAGRSSRSVWVREK